MNEERELNKSNRILGKYVLRFIILGHRDVGNHIYKESNLITTECFIAEM